MLSETLSKQAKELSRRLIDCSGDLRRPLKKMTFHEYVEFSSLDEFKKFRTLPAINKKDLKDLNWDQLLMSLYERCFE